MTRIAMGGGPKRLADCLPDRWRSALSSRIDEGSRLRHVWHALVPEPLASHAHPVRYAAGLLYVHADTAAWASRLRHEQPGLIASLRGNVAFRDLTNIRCRVVPRPSALPRSPERPVSRLSARAAKVIGQTAATIAHPGLRAALERLSRRTDTEDEAQRRS